MAEVYIARTKKDDPLHKYLYIEDADGKEIPSWIFIDKLQVAEPALFIYEEASKYGYKTFHIETDSGFWKGVVAAKEITAEDIANDYAEYLLANKVVVVED